MYINKTNDRNVWCPTCNCSSCVNNEGRIKGYTCKDYVEDYMTKPQKIGKCKVEI